MGVPQFIRFLNTHCVQAFSTNIPSNVQALFSDFNSVIHCCASETNDQAGCIELACEHIAYLIDKVKPTQVTYIAIDGAPPRCKMQQQRYRRYNAQNRNVPWDTNAITPGTDFMDALADRIRDRLGDAVVLSDANESGEGEQKIASFIRAHAFSSVAIHGMDADLVMLSMGLSEAAASVVVLREAYLRSTVTVIDIDTVLKWVHRLGLSSKDFVALIGLFGNDFVPCLSSLILCRADFDLVMRAYSEATTEVQRPLVDRGPPELFGVDLRVLHALLKRLAMREESMIARKDDSLIHCRQWRNAYYHQVLGERTPEGVSGMVFEYLTGVTWSIAYHHQVLLSEGWYYRHTHAPLLSDIVSAIGSLDALTLVDAARRLYHTYDTSYRLYKTIRPPMRQLDWNLLLVLPPRSFKLINDPRVRRLVSGATHYMYPSSFQHTSFLFVKQYQHLPKLPLLDLDALATRLCEIDGVPTG